MKNRYLKVVTMSHEPILKHIHNIVASVKKPLLFILILLTISACATKPTNRINLNDLYDDTMDAYENKEYLAAEQGLNMLSNRVPEDVLVWFRLGNIYARTDRPKLAIRAYEEALLRNPNLPKPWHNKGMMELYIALFTFNDMLLHITETDPFYASALRIQSILSDLIQEDFEAVPVKEMSCDREQSEINIPTDEPTHHTLIPQEMGQAKINCGDDKTRYLPLPSTTQTTPEPSTDAGIDKKMMDEAPSTQMDSVEKPAEIVMASEPKTEMAMEKEEPAETKEVAPAIEPSSLKQAQQFEVKFDYLSSIIKAENTARLDEVSKSLLSASSIEIQGVTGSNGDPKYNEILAAERANSIHSYLVNMGVSSDNINILPWDTEVTGFKAMITAYQ